MAIKRILVKLYRNDYLLEKIIRNCIRYFLLIPKKILLPIAKRRSFCIVCPLELINNAFELKKQIINNGINCEIRITNNKWNLFSPFKIYIILGGIGYRILPLIYIYYNFEQCTIDHWWKDWHLIRFKKSIAVFDYSILNVNFLIKKHHIKNVFYMPLCGSYKYSGCKKDIDILFYGRMNERRQKIIDKIKTKTNIMCIDNCFGPKIDKILERTKIVLNIHSYDRAILETTRIFECISHGCIVISEKSEDYFLDKQFLSNVIFIDQFEEKKINIFSTSFFASFLTNNMAFLNESRNINNKFLNHYLKFKKF